MTNAALGVTINVGDRSSIPLSHLQTAFRVAYLEQCAAEARTRRLAVVAAEHIIRTASDVGLRDEGKQTVRLPRAYTITSRAYGDESESRYYHSFAHPNADTYDELISSLIADLDDGLIDEVHHAGTSADNRTDRLQSKKTRKASTERRVTVLGHDLPFKPGWHYEAAVKMADGTLVVPRANTITYWRFDSELIETELRLARAALVRLPSGKWRGVCLRSDRVVGEGTNLDMVIETSCNLANKLHWREDHEQLTCPRSMCQRGCEPLSFVG